MPIIKWVAVRIAADQIVQHAAVAYWKDGDPYHTNCVHGEFKKLAERLGYTVELKEPEQGTKEAA